MIPLWLGCVIGLVGVFLGMVLMGVLAVSRWAGEMEPWALQGGPPLGEQADLSRIASPLERQRCKVCGTPLGKEWWRYEQDGRRFCSRECRNAYFAARSAGAGGSNA